MQAVILAAGRGTRMGSLTDNCPKPMLKVLDKNLLQWKLEALPECVDEVIFVVGYLKKVIQNYFGENFVVGNKKYKISYIEQKTLDGTMGSLALCKDVLRDRFMVLMGDDIYSKTSLQDLLKYPLSILGIRSQAPLGKIYKNEEGIYAGIKEGMVESGYGEEYTACGAYVLDKRIFDCEPVLVKEGEYGLPHTMLARWQQDPNFKVKVVETEEWINITSPESIELAEELLK